MNTLDGLAILTPYNNLLDPNKYRDQKRNAWAILHEFFAFYDKDSAKECLWYMLVLALKSNSETVTARHRSNMIFFYEYCVALFKAAQVLCGPERQKTKKLIK